jgi:hypothetical protein
MDAPVLDEILQDARAMAFHALRCGTLPQDSLLFDLIDAAAQAKARGESPSISALVAEIVRVSEAADITLKQLRGGRSRLGRLRHSAALSTPFLVGFMTLLLTLYLGFQSSELHKADLALREYQDLVSERLPEKIYLAWKAYHYDQPLNAKGPQLAQLDGYQKLVDDAKRLYEKRGAVRKLLLNAQPIRYMPSLLEYSGPCWSRDFARLMNVPSPNDFVSACPLPVAGSAGGYGADLRTLQEAEAPPLACGNLMRQPGDSEQSQAGQITNADFTASVDCFLQSLQLTDGSYHQPLVDLIYGTRNKVNLLVSWLLPGLYGLLGACVFVMRALLLSNGRKPRQDEARIVDLLSLLLRVALGGLAGIIIGWFWVPSGVAGGSPAISVSAIPFGMAFLAGFSIETLFSMLEGLNRIISHQTESKPSAATDAAAKPVAFNT